MILFTSIIGYIITNAVKHGYSTTVESYPYSAYKSLLSEKPTKLLRSEVIDWFGTKTNFINYILNYQNDIKNQRDLFESLYDE
jgi:putative transposase